MGKRFTICFLLALSSFISQSDAQWLSAKYFKLGATASVNVINNTTNIPIFYNSNQCGHFSNGTATGFSIGLIGLYPIYGESLFLDIRAYYERRPLNLTTERVDFEVFNTLTNAYEPLKIKYDYDAHLDYLNLDVAIRYKPFQEYDFFFKLGITAGNTLFGSNYKVTSEILSPQNMVYPDGRANQQIFSGEVSNAGTSLGANIGLIYEYKLKNDIYLQPEISYFEPLNSGLSGADYKSRILKLNLSALWKINLINELADTTAIVQETPKPIEVIKEVDIIKSISIQPIEVFETTVTQTYPILPYIFFEEKSKELKKSYNQNYDTEFDESKLPKETMGIYYNLLNIIGNRLNKSKSQIEIRGHSDGKELANKEERINLARKRAESVAEYLTNKCGINKGRISITATDVPELQTSLIYSEGYDENRRVEIISNDNTLFKPVVHKKFSEYSLSSDSLKFTIEVDSNHNELKYQYIIHTDSAEIASEYFTNENNKKIFGFKINEKLKQKFLLHKDNLKLSVRLTDANTKKSYTKTANIDWKNEISNFELGRLNLIVFDFDKSAINSTNSDMIRDFINNSIYDASQLMVIGSTDKLGEKSYNQKLSQFRADNTADFIRKLNSNLNIKEVNGIGNSKLIYDNNLPEGRFYCRTVLIEVKTPINK